MFHVFISYVRENSVLVRPLGAHPPTHLVSLETIVVKLEREEDSPTPKHKKSRSESHRGSQYALDREILKLLARF